MTIPCKAIHARSCLLGCLLLCLLGLGPTSIAQTAPVSFGNITGFAGVQGNSTDSSSSPAALATATDIGFPSAVVTDSFGNAYFADQTQNVVWEVYGGDSQNPGLISLFFPAPYATGYAYAVVNAGGNTCVGPSLCGDTGLATAASLHAPSGLAFNGNDFFIADTGSQAIRVVDRSSGTISTIAGDPMHQMSGYSGEAVPAGTALLNGPTSVAVYNSNVYVAETGNNIIQVIDGNGFGNISTFAGTVPLSNVTPVVCTAAPCGDGGPATSATFAHLTSISADVNGNIYASDAGAAAVRKIDTSGTINTVAGTLLAGAPFPDTCAPETSSNCGDGGPATSALLNSPASTYADANGVLYIVDSYDNTVRRVDTHATIQTIAGQLSAAGGYEGGDPGPAEGAKLNHPFGIAFCPGVALCPSGIFYVTDQNNNIVRQVTPAALLKQQTLAFSAPAGVTYGDKPIDLSVDATSTDTITAAPTGLNASFSVTSGPGTLSGSMLTITGAGSIVLSVSQAGNSIYGPATPLSATITAAKATLTVTASQTASLIQGNPIPATLPAQDYSITGFVNPDPSSVVTGSPSFQVTDASGAVFPTGNIPANGYYTIGVGAGTLLATNYNFTFVSGTLLVTQGLAQTLSFGSYTPPTVYGGANSTFGFSVTSSVQQPAVVTPSGPVKLQQLTTTTWSATVIGAGAVTLTAIQGGNLTYLPATAMAQFVVSPAVLTIPLANATRQYGAQNPAFSYGTPTGFVGTDNSSVLSGAPSATTMATATSDPGTYPLTPNQGTLSAQNYSFTFLPATLTITKATQQITNFTAPANVLGLGSSQPLQAMATSGGPIVYSATGAVQIEGNSSFQATGVGPATITATQAGSADYAPVSSTVSFNVAQVTQYVSAVAVSVPLGAAIPPLNWCWASIDLTTGLPFCDASTVVPADLYSGAPAVNTTAAQGSPVGTYPQNVSMGTLTSSVYAFVFEPGVLTISPASTYTLSVNPSSITIPNGQSRQVTITLTPVNNYIGTVALACSGLPAGVTCTASPANLTTTVNYQGIANPVSGTLTISANQVVARNTTGDTSGLLAAGMLGVPGVFAGVLIFYRRRQFKQHSIYSGILILIGLGVSMTCLSACGGGSSHSPAVQAATTQIMITGSGTASAGTAVSQTVALTVTVQ